MAEQHDLFPRALSLAVHEFRTPVTVVSGYLRMLLREQAGPLTDMQRKMLEEADRSCSRINTLVAEMSDLGKLEAGEVAIAQADFDLCALVSELAGNMHDGEDRGIRLTVRAEQPVVVTGDRTRIAAALKALMHAALRERGTPGEILVQCSTIEHDRSMWALVAIGEEPVTRTLADSARSALPPFDEWRGGLGLALPVGRRVIEAHGGAVWSAPGETPRAGSAVRLPLGNGTR